MTAVVELDLILPRMTRAPDAAPQPIAQVVARTVGESAEPPRSSHSFTGAGLLGLLLPVAAALIYEAVAQFGLVSTRLVPPPSSVLAALWDLALKGELWVHAKATLLRVGLGFLFGTAAATIIGALTGYVPLIRNLLDPTLQALRNVPSIAWVPLFILWFSIFETSKVLLIAVGVFFPVYLALVVAVRDGDRKLVEAGRVMGLSPLALVARVIFPSVLPAYVTGLRTGLGLGWMFVVAAEFMGASEGLGFLLVDGQMAGKPTTILAAITAFAVLGKLTDALLTAATRPLIAWQDAHGSEGNR
jgi:sulfonate transport system permease protein